MYDMCMHNMNIGYPGLHARTVLSRCPRVASSASRWCGSSRSNSWNRRGSRRQPESCEVWATCSRQLWNTGG